MNDPVIFVFVAILGIVLALMWDFVTDSLSHFYESFKNNRRKPQ